MITNIQNLTDRITKLEGDYRLILSSLLNNNKAAVAIIKSSGTDFIKKQELLKYFEKNIQQINQYLIPEKINTLPKNQLKY